MDIEHVRTFLAVAAHGSFLEAAARLYVTQSTVSARVQTLEQTLGNRLFVRNRAGASLTPAGKRFLRHAKTLVLTYQQAKYEVGLPNRYRAILTLGARIALWESDLLLEWVGRLRQVLPDISIHSDIGFDEHIVRQLIAGSIDIGLLYNPQHTPGLQIEHLFDETLVLVGTHPEQEWPNEGYVYVDWGAGFQAEHANCFPHLERPAVIANIGWLAVQLILRNGGSCFIPQRLGQRFLQSGQLHRIPNAPQFKLPAYLVYPTNTSEECQQALALLKDCVRDLQLNTPVKPTHNPLLINDK